MIQKVNKKYAELFTRKARYFILMGGRSGARSHTASQFTLAKLLSPDYFRCAVMRYVLNDVRNSIFQDVLDRAEDQEITEALDVREHALTITYGGNRVAGLGFLKSRSERKAKLKSLANFNCVIIEEADEVSEADFMQLDDSLRTLKSDITVVLLLNAPPKNHWIIRRWFNLIDCGIPGFYQPVLKESAKGDTVYIHTTYEDNRKNINETTILNFERYLETNPEHYWSMIKGLVSEGARGLIYKHWQQIPDAAYDELPYPDLYWMDFGFTNDPTSIGKLKMHNETIWAHQLIYETGLTNPAISLRMEQLGIPKNAIIYADSAEPKSIEEIKRLGWINIRPAVKGPDSVRAGVNMLLEKTVFYTESSKPIDTERQEYRWALDANKEPTNDPIDDFNHSMDGIRYVVFTHTKRKKPGII